MTRVAILGSCITRDLWPGPGDAPEDLLYISRTSLPSLFASAPPFFPVGETPPEPLRPFQHRAMVADLRKTALARLVAFRPSHIVVDFIDERFDLLAAGRVMVTRTWELEASGYGSRSELQGLRRVPRLSSAAERLWLEGLGELAALIRATPLAQARLILHSARWATTHLDADGHEAALTGVEVLPGEPADPSDFNRLLARYEAAFQAVMPPHAVVEAPESRVATSAHRWGLSPFHYAPAYYEAIADQLRALGIEGLSGRFDAPSAPAA